KGLFERSDGGAELAEIGVQRAALAPELGALGRQQQHAVENGERRLALLRADQAELQIVLQAEQYLAIADRGVVARLKLAPAAGDRLQQLAQLRRALESAAGERIEDADAVGRLETQEEMAGKGEARHLPALRAARMEIENAERHRQPLAAVDD